MSSVLQEVHAITKALYEHLNEPLPKDEGREEYIETVESYLTKRGKLMEKLEQPKTDEEKQLAKEVLDMNQPINERLAAAQGMIRIDLNQLKKRKNTGKKYETPYAGPTADGVFFDSKK
ncbi:flagellar protein [Bacillus shivajii]|uniref:flagellar protein n=1 Tax=Bacillus shivajii TaxID=1983719 RepID=UPI001CF9822F|nr:flagellar protein [Bacillus shivajii]UCZ52682.1 flagellar protein [Bacillus shivajii]